jgi:hypothetical protein
MSAVFAFDVAAPLEEAPAATAEYDPARQLLVWEGDGDASLGSPVCTGGRYSGRNPCRTTSTACYGTSCSTSSYPGCYACDYG